MRYFIYCRKSTEAEDRQVASIESQLTTLQRALRAAPDGLPQVSTGTILHTLWDAGYSWQESRTWCHTGTVVRKRKAGPVEVTDPDTTPKKT